MKYDVSYLGERPEFLDELTELWINEWGQRKDSQFIEQKKEKYRERLNIGSVPFVLVAHQDKKILGTAGLAEHDLETRPAFSPWLVGVLVKPEYRRQGIASDLVSRVVSEAKRLGYSRLYLHTENAQALYEKLGWKFVEHTTNDNRQETDIYYLDFGSVDKD